MIGERLLELRKDADMTQDELAAVLKINKHSISSYERNRSEPPDDIKIAIANYFGVSIDYLLGVTDAPAPYNEQSNCMRFPAPLTAEERKAIQDYASYLMYKRTIRKNEKTHR